MPSPRQGHGGMQKSLGRIWPSLVVPSLATGCERNFGLVAMWTHPHQVWLASLAEVAQCLVLLASEGPDWLYTFVYMNDTILHAPLSSKGHLGILMEGKPQRNPWGFLHQLHAWKLLQCLEWVVCPVGLNMGLDTLVFDFMELPLLDMATTGEAAWNPTMIEVDLSCMPHKAMSTTLAASHVSASETWPTIAKTFNLHIEGAFKQVQQTSPTTSMPISQHSTLRRKLPSGTLVAPPPPK